MFTAALRVIFLHHSFCLSNALPSHPSPSSFIPFHSINPLPPPPPPHTSLHSYTPSFSSSCFFNNFFLQFPFISCSCVTPPFFSLAYSSALFVSSSSLLSHFSNTSFSSCSSAPSISSFSYTSLLLSSDVFHLFLFPPILLCFILLFNSYPTILLFAYVHCRFLPLSSCPSPSLTSGLGRDISEVW